jgi:hypothetical protein
MPHSGRSQYPSGSAQLGGELPFPISPAYAWFDSGPSRIRGKDRGEAAGHGHHSGIPACRNASATRAYKSVWLFDCYSRSETDLK